MNLLETRRSSSTMGKRVHAQHAEPENTVGQHSANEEPARRKGKNDTAWERGQLNNPAKKKSLSGSTQLIFEALLPPSRRLPRRHFAQAEQGGFSCRRGPNHQDLLCLGRSKQDFPPINKAWLPPV